MEHRGEVLEMYLSQAVMLYHESLFCCFVFSQIDKIYIDDFLQGRYQTRDFCELEGFEYFMCKRVTFKA